MTLLDDALDRSRQGDVQGATDILLQAHDLDAGGQALLFTLLRAAGTLSAAIEYCGTRLEAADDDASRSLWALRRALLHLEAEERNAAQRDLTDVLRLNVNEDHAAQARRALLQTVSPGRGREARS